MRKWMEKIRPSLSRSGVAGLIEYLDSPERGRLARFLLALDRRFVGVVQYGRDTVLLEQQMDAKGVPAMARAFLDNLSMDVQVNAIPDVFARPGQPTILLGLNHEAIIEPIVLSSFLMRSDLKLTSIKVFDYLGPQMAHALLPVMPRKVAVDYSGGKLVTRINRLDPIYQLYALEKLTEAEIAQLNQQSLERGAEHLAAGGALIIFPTGGQSVEKPWHRGTGELLSLLAPEVLSTTLIFPISIMDLTRKLYLWQAHRSAFDKQRPATIRADIGDPILIPDWAADFTPQQILDYLQKRTLMQRMRAQKE
jgi:1-acyl-sn-glycerol-3-phosphate acyltransferase